MSESESFRLEHVSFAYPRQTGAALNDVCLTIQKGQFVTLCGPSGCGKTTLLRQLKTVLAPHGARSGAILLEGAPLEELSQRVQSEKIGFVLQSPENQIVTDKVWHELAFGLEGLGYDSQTIRLRVAEMASFFGIQTWFYRLVTSLSGGQKQLLNLAAVMTMQPSVLILDEPTSQLDPIAAADFLATVGKINRELGVTVLLSEHRLEDALPLSDRCIVMDGGRVIADGPPADVGETLRAQGHSMFRAMPTPMRIWAGVENALPCPITVRDGRTWLTEVNQIRPVRREIPPVTPAPAAPPIIQIQQAWFRYEKDGPDVVKGLSLEIAVGEFCALVGGNGTGKTTTLSLISGLNRPYRGTVRVDARRLEEIPQQEKFQGLLGVLPQNPQALFVKKTVELDLYEILAGRNFSQAEQDERVAAVAARCALEGLLGQHPYDLSGGEQQRAALAKVLLLEPRILLLDEPTKGMDSCFKEKFAGILQQLLAEQVTILMVSHDIEFCARYAHRCAMVFDGTVVTDAPARAFFAGNSFYTTAANRMARHLIADAVTAEDVIAACGGGEAPQDETMRPPERPTPPTPAGGEKPPVTCQRGQKGTALENEETPPHVARHRPSRRGLLAGAMILLLIPLTIFVGFFFLDNRKYYFISILILLETLVPFLLAFEGRRPQARELVVLAVLCAIAVAGRAIFPMLPQFKPVAALVIITAVAFGGESGFIVGALTMFLSNMLYGQGPWTPWQMFAMGIIGFLAGVLFRKGILPRDRIALCAFGFLVTFLVYGVIMNLSVVFTYQETPTLAMAATYCIVGIPMDLVHGASTAFFLWVAGPAMLEKLDRMKSKYGLVRT